ncbi:uncharacterized protein CTRU02_212793 [Colletotrichum truncatum]|uniref:Uncharacterized protein n=1 Tax=Colletotrichum truncatum TaxID=5467 RepID=A0ACC3YIX3_COLTU|nr:uncharacterized protein CTRU02_03114 [Colletotrichum truncatum]KAF6797083.1 hypothetical protein CTRU02_03114 [Colletotrichum truncatum]
MRLSFTRIAAATLAILSNSGAVLASPAPDVAPVPLPSPVTPLPPVPPTELPKADLCCCNTKNWEWQCKVPHVFGGSPDPPCTKALCPWNPKKEKQCCCCMPGPGWNVQCRRTPINEPCICLAIYCGIAFDETWLPGYPGLPKPPIGNPLPVDGA